MLCKIGALRVVVQHSKEKHLCRSLHFNNYGCWPATSGFRYYIRSSSAGVFLTIMRNLIATFLSLNKNFWKKHCSGKCHDAIFVFQVVTASYKKSYQSKKSTYYWVFTISDWPKLSNEFFGHTIEREKQHANIKPLILLSDVVTNCALLPEMFNFLSVFNIPLLFYQMF